MNGFTIYKEYYDLITLLPEKDQEKMLLAITKYMFDDEEPRLNEKQLKIFNNLRRPLMKSKEQSKRKTKQQPNENQTETNTKPNNNQMKTHQDVNVIVNVNNNNLYEYIENNLGRTLSPIEYELISTWDDNELTRYAVKQTVLNRATSLKYTQAILNAYKAKGIKSVEEAEQHNFKTSKNNIPNWMNRDIKAEMITKEEKQELDDLLMEFK